MDILRVYFEGDDGKCKSLEFATSSWYHKPKIISAIAYSLQYYCNLTFLFVTSTKYGCAQFSVKQSMSFPVHCLNFAYYKDKLPWVVPEFNDYAKSGDFSPSKYFQYDKVLKETWPDLFVDNIGPLVKLPF